jgi:hypothetical protein
VKLATRDLAGWLVVSVVVAAFPASAGAQAPSASFDYTPPNPRVGDTVQFVSSSCDPRGHLWSQDWDLDGDAFFAEGTGPTASATFDSPGPHAVGLEVTGANGNITTLWRTIVVDAADAPARPEDARLMTPFPVVTLGGRLERGATRINLFTVRAPVCAWVSVTCQGRGCPMRTVTGRVGQGALRLREVERRFRAGNRLTVAVWKGALVGKVTTFVIRRRSAPLRSDRCLMPGSLTGSRCPGG